MKEDKFNDFEFRYKGVDIKTYENAKLGDKILFCGEYRNVLTRENGNLIIQMYMIYNDGKRSNKVAYLKDLVYFYYNNLLSKSDNETIIHIDNNTHNLHINNLKMIYKSVPEDKFNDFEFRYKDVDIKTYENAKKGDKILFCGKYYLVYNHEKFIMIGVTVLLNITDKPYLYRLHLKDLIYWYYNGLLKNEDNTHIVYIDENRSDNINDISNIRSIYTIMPEDKYCDWNFRYQLVDDISVYENAKLGDKIPFGDRKYTVGYDRPKGGRLGINVTFLDNETPRKFQFPLYRLVYEYGHKIILKTENVIHHIDFDKYNNKLDNLCKLTADEHNEIHKKEQYKHVINLNTGEVFGSLKEAAFVYHLDPSQISHCCLKHTNSAGGYRWEFLSKYNYSKEEIENSYIQENREILFKCIFDIADLWKFNSIDEFKDEFLEFSNETFGVEDIYEVI